MTMLTLALYCEGRTDERFLPILIQRTIEQVLLQRGRSVVDVLEPSIVRLEASFSSQAERSLTAARQTAGYHVLIVHADADYPTPRRALDERFLPGLNLVRHASGPKCEIVVPLIPVRMTEA